MISTKDIQKFIYFYKINKFFLRKGTYDEQLNDKYFELRDDHVSILFHKTRISIFLHGYKTKNNYLLCNSDVYISLNKMKTNNLLKFLDYFKKINYEQHNKKL
jgi:hypothetical protein